MDVVDVEEPAPGSNVLYVEISAELHSKRLESVRCDRGCENSELPRRDLNQSRVLELMLYYIHIMPLR